jgi:D-glycero-alpha-D-manno-heptose-7-phosphate kinase
MPEDTVSFPILELSMLVTKTGSVRVDLVGGTLDLEPINLILPNVVTLNVATSLKAKVTLEDCPKEEITIISKDYDKIYNYQKSQMTYEDLYQKNTFEEMTFVLQIIDFFKFESGLRVILESGAPAGSGLGGSSAMGVTLYSALCEKFDVKTDVLATVKKIMGTEGRILNKGMPGYQDYFPALTGGVLSLKGLPGEIQVEQLYTQELVAFLESHITLVYSGISRNSGINNWDVYKSFFDGDENIRTAMENIACISYKTYQAIKSKSYNDVLSLIGEEGEARKLLSPNIVPKEVSAFYDGLVSDDIVNGLKMCGAGGGGCFILTHDAEHKSKISTSIENASFIELGFKIDAPLG